MNPYLIAYINSIFASIFTGVHLFSVKYLRVKPQAPFYLIAFVSFIIWGLSRIFAYQASSVLPITLIHIIMNMSILVSTLFSVLILNTQIEWFRFSCGVLFMLIGVFFVQISVKDY